MRHEHPTWCVIDPVGVCRYSRENLHFEYCAHFQPLPSDTEAPYKPSIPGQDYGFHDQRAGAQEYHPFAGRDAQARQYDSGFEDRYGNIFGNRRGRSFSDGHAGDNPRAYFRDRYSRSNNNYDYADEYENDSSGSEVYLSGDSFGEDQLSEPEGGQVFDSSFNVKRPRGFSLDSHGQKSRVRGFLNSYRRETLTSTSNVRGGTIGLAHGGPGDHASTRGTSHDAPTPAILAHKAAELESTTKKAAELDPTLLSELATNKPTRHASAYGARLRRQPPLKRILIESRAELEATSVTHGEVDGRHLLP